MTEPQRVSGQKRFLRPRRKYLYIPVEHEGHPITHVFIAPQELSGLEQWYVDPEIEGNSITISGDIMIGNPNDGYYEVNFAITITDETESPLLLGEEEYDLNQGRAFRIDRGYRIVQLPAQTQKEGVALLP